MPWNPDGTRKKSSSYKMKYSNSAFPFKSSSAKEVLQAKRDAMSPAERLLAVVPDKAAYNALKSDEERADFDKAAKAAGLPTMKG